MRFVDRKFKRKRRVTSTAQGVEVEIDGQKLISFCSNDYLGLSNHPLLVEALIAGAKKYGVGSGSAHLLGGHSAAHHTLEEELAEFTGNQRALLFSTGYMANLGVLDGLLQRGDLLLQDRLNHASLLDGGRLSAAKMQRYQHNNLDSLQQCLPDTSFSKQIMIATDGVFSMDGDLTLLPELATLSEKNHAMLLVDDAHGFGVLGENGRGSLEESRVEQSNSLLLMGTLGKALGSAGAFVSGSYELIEELLQSARSYIYTTAQPPAVAEASRAALHLIQTEPERRTKLKELIGYFRNSAQQLGLTISSSKTAIQPIQFDSVELLMQKSEKLWQAGVWAPAIRPPTVAKGTERLRISLSANHTHNHIDRLLDNL